MDYVSVEQNAISFAHLSDKIPYFLLADQDHFLDVRLQRSAIAVLHDDV